jgi:hypothetical protein
LILIGKNLTWLNMNMTLSFPQFLKSISVISKIYFYLS